MRRTIHTLIALSATVSLATPALAGGADTPISAWGSSGIILTPSAHVLGFQDVQATGGYIGGTNQGFGTFHMGLLQGLEAGLTYNTPGAPMSLAGDFKLRLIKQTGAMPFSLALGGMQLGGNATQNLGLNNQLYMVLGHDVQWSSTTLARLSLGFGGNLSGAQPMASLQIPILHVASVEAEFVGQRGTTEALINVGASLNPLPWLGFKIASLGTWNQDITTRAWMAGANLTWKIPNSGNILDSKDSVTPPAPAKTPNPVISPPPVIANSTLPSPAASHPANGSTATASPTPTVDGLVQGKVTSGGKGVDRIPLQLNGPQNRKAWTEPDGSYKFPRAPVGAYKLKIVRDGWKPVEQDVTVVAGTTEVNVALTALPATLKGLVSSGMKGVGGVTVSIDSLGIATLTKEDGMYTLADIPAGTYVIAYSQKKKPLDKVTLTLGQGETLQRNYTMSATDAPAIAKALLRGTISDAVKANLAGARIQLEGKDLTVMTISGPDGAFVLRELPAGAYKLTVSKKGFVSRFFSLTLKPGQETKHAIALTVAPAGK